MWTTEVPLPKTERSQVKSMFSFALSYNMHLFDDYEDTGSCEFRQLYPRRNHCSLIFIFAIIDSKGLTNNCLDFFSACVVAQKINLEMNRGRWVFLKMAFLISSKQQGSFSPHVHLNWLVLWLRAYSTCLPPARLLYPVDHWLIHVLPLLSLSSGSSCGALRLWLTGGRVRRTPLLLSSLPRQRGRGAMSRGSGRQPLLCVPDSQLEAAHCRRRVGCRVNCRGPNSWLYQGPLCLQQLSQQLRPGCNRWLISPVPDDTSISTRQVLFRTRSCLWLPPACPSFYSRLTEVGRGCHRPWSYLQRSEQ